MTWRTTTSSRRYETGYATAIYGNQHTANTANTAAYSYSFRTAQLYQIGSVRANFTATIQIYNTNKYKSNSYGTNTAISTAINTANQHTNGIQIRLCYKFTANKFTNKYTAYSNRIWSASKYSSCKYKYSKYKYEIRRNHKSHTDRMRMDSSQTDLRICVDIWIAIQWIRPEYPIRRIRRICRRRVWNVKFQRICAYACAGYSWICRNNTV